MRADSDNLGMADTGGFKHVLAGAVAEINAEAEFARSPHTIGRVVDNSHVDATSEQYLRGNLSVTRKADHQNVRASAFEVLFDNIFRLVLNQQF